MKNNQSYFSISGQLSRGADDRMGDRSPIAEEIDVDQGGVDKISGASLLTQEQPSDIDQDSMGPRAGGAGHIGASGAFRPHAAEDDVSRDAYSTSGGDDIRQLSGVSGSFRAESGFGHGVRAG